MVIINNNYQTLTITNITGFVAEGLRLAEAIDVPPTDEEGNYVSGDPTMPFIEYLYGQDLSWQDIQKTFKDQFLMYVHQKFPRNEDFAHRLRISSGQASALRKKIGAAPRKKQQ
jgi:hypothetical protein